VEDDIVNLIVAVDERPSILRLHPLVFEELYHIVEVRYRPYRFICLYISRLSLELANCRESLDLPVVETGGLAIALKTNIFRLNLVEFGKCSYGIAPPVLPSVTLLRYSCRRTDISALSSGVTSGMLASTIILPSRNSMI